MVFLLHGRRFYEASSKEATILWVLGPLHDVPSIAGSGDQALWMSYA